jgi:uracil-DNA glycosylase
MKTRSAQEPSRTTSNGSRLRNTAKPLIPSKPTLSRLTAAARLCQACPLWRRATQTVFGDGPERAKVFFVGEQPGFDEDLAGRPFVGPDAESRLREMELFINDLRKVAGIISR